MAMHVILTARDGEQECTVCGGKGQTLPCECPGKPLTEEQKAKIAARDMDYTRGRWRYYVDFRYDHGLPKDS